MSEHPPPQEARWPDGAIFTLGHSTLPIESFVALLRTYGIVRLVDIRTIPRSRHNPQFNATALAESLKAQHLAYVHLKALGGLRRPRKASRAELPAGSTGTTSKKLCCISGGESALTTASMPPSASFTANGMSVSEIGTPILLTSAQSHILSYSCRASSSVGYGDQSIPKCRR